MQKVRGHSEELPLFVGTRFQVLFHSPLGVLFTFPSWYSFTIGQQGVLRLGGWSPQIPTEFQVFRGTQERATAIVIFVYGGFTLSALAFQLGSTNNSGPISLALQPLLNRSSVGLAYSHFARTTSGISNDFSSSRY